MYKLLIIEDEPAICTSLQFALEDDYEVYTANTEADAIELIANGEIELVLLDLRLGPSDGIEVLKKIKQLNDRMAVIIMTAYGSIQSSVDAMRAGAFYYITKPINIDELRMLLLKVTEYICLKSKVHYLNDKLTKVYEVTGMIGVSAAMRSVFQQIDKIKNIDSTVLITGESGTGKELVAKAIHYGGCRKNEPFEVINCAAIPGELLESELFGYEKGAFTGAVHRKKGILELAHKGTLFLDEIGEMDLRLQSKLLRVVQEKEITPVGSGVRKKIDVRIICATNRDLRKEVAAGRFREDLFFRLNVIIINIPSLRARVEDMPVLAQHFIDKYNQKMGRNITGIDTEALNCLCDYECRGNVRELENIVERAIVFAEGPQLTVADLPEEVVRARRSTCNGQGMLIPIYIGENLKDIEKKVITKTLKYLNGDKQEAARRLKISERKLWYKIKEYEEGE
ncbi:sigma-54 dependent transcriptional regulator [Sporomusa sp.]|uniref:sigma-54-dependent transcriptional regulator n=1 Tax=Sporomusa sp. TaxID=2078658 RepID=UPI002B6A1CB8|nr:sigma-54 dependent transcriptional regulator [Sporomusa sp.]HWR45940.1 sigma-54 dependent transcriptional regulator [Sporomusa sp.]